MSNKWRFKDNGTENPDIVLECGGNSVDESVQILINQLESGVFGTVFIKGIESQGDVITELILGTSESNIDAVNERRVALMNDFPDLGLTKSAKQEDLNRAIVDLIKNVSLSAGAGLYENSITPTSTVPDVESKVFTVTIPGTYTNFGGVNLPANYWGFIFKNGNSFSIQSVEIKLQDLTEIEAELENTKTKVDDFIRDFAVTTDTEFNSESKNPISNSAVAPLATMLSGFLTADYDEVVDTDMSGSIVGLMKSDENSINDTGYRYKKIVLDKAYNYVNFKGYRPQVLAAGVNSFPCLIAVNSSGTKVVLIESDVNTNQQTIFEKKVSLPANTTHIYVNWNNSGTSLNQIPKTSLFLQKSGISEENAVKEYIDEKTAALDSLNGEREIKLVFTNLGIYDKTGKLFTNSGFSFRSTIIPITSNAVSFRFKGNQAAIGNNWNPGTEGYSCVAFKMSDDTFSIALHPTLTTSKMIDKTFSIPNGAKEIYLSWQNLADAGGNAILPELFFIDEPLTLDEYLSSITSKVPKSHKYDLSWRNFLGNNKVNISESFVTGTQQERLQQALDFAEGKSITLILGKDHLSSSTTWNIESSLLIGDDTALVIEKGIKIKFSKNYVVDTIIRNKGIGTIADAALHSTDYMTGTGRTSKNKNIIILGAGEEHTLIEGSDIPYRANRPFTNTEEDWVGDEYGWRTLSILMCNVDGLEIGGFSLRKPKCWMIPIFNSLNLWIHDLDLLSRVRNGDGVDIIGCHGGIVENVVNDLYDDAVFVGYVSKRNINFPHYQYIYPSVPNILEVKEKPISFQDTSNIDIKNISGNSRSVICRIMVVDGPKVSNVSVNGLISYDLGRAGLCAFTVEGSYEGNITPPASVGDITNISANNIIASNASFGFGEVCRVEAMARNVWINNVTNKTSSRTINTGLDASVKVTNVK